MNDEIWAYADDIAFGFRSQEEFDKKVNIIREFCRTSGMKLNVNKCELLNLGSKPVISEFPCKNVIKYLGVLINKQRKLKDHFAMIKEKVRPVANRVALIASNRVQPARLIQLFFVIVKSSVDYGSVIFNTQRPTLVEPLEQFCRVILKKILRLKASTFNAVVDQLIGIPQVEWHQRWMGKVAHFSPPGSYPSTSNQGSTEGSKMEEPTILPHGVGEVKARDCEGNMGAISLYIQFSTDGAAGDEYTPSY